MLLYKSILKIITTVSSPISYLFCHIHLIGNNVKYKSFTTTGIPYIMVARGGQLFIGRNFSMNNGAKGNPIGHFDPCTFFVDKGATLIIGDNVGISQTALVCIKSITIGDNVKIGGGTAIYDTDFHSLDSGIRNNIVYDKENTVKIPVVIGDNVFIGARSIILKGVTIGANVIIGAGSVVTKSIPANEIWAGNPAKFIRKI